MTAALSPRIAAAALAALLVLLPAPRASAQTEQVVEVPTRPGKSVRMLLISPPRATAAVILLAGGHGNLGLGTDGRMKWGEGNQLVRTRAAYAAAGLVTAVPDIAADMKEGNGGVMRYRVSEAHAQDLARIVAYMRTLTPRVYLVGTSRGALSAFNAVARDPGPDRPDAVVVTSGMLLHLSDKHISVERDVGRLERVRQPTLLVYHRKDGCSYTPASSAGKFKPLLTKASRVEVEIIDGGSAGSGDVCGGRSHHGFQGQDQEVVSLVTGWLEKVAGR